MDEKKYSSDEKNQFKIVVGIDFGTDGSGLAYAIPDANGTSTVYIHDIWKDVISTQKPKTSILFDHEGNVQSTGNPAVSLYINCQQKKGWKLFERFKMSLYEHSPQWISNITTSTESRKNKTVDIKEKIRASNGNIEEYSEVVFVACLKWLKSEAMKFIDRLKKKRLYKKRKFSVAEHEIKWILTVPAIWSEKAKQKMKDWAIKAGLIKSENDNNYVHNQFKIVYEPDCASLSIQHAILRNIEKDNNNNKKQSKLLAHRPQININAKFKENDTYILLDVGGGTCDVACHEVLGDFAIAEVLHPSGGPWGASNIDNEFRILLNKIFTEEWMNEFEENNPGMYQQLFQNFIIQSKTTFYDGYKINNKNYHSVTIVRNFYDHIFEKFEIDEIREKYGLMGGEEEEEDNDDDDYDYDNDINDNDNIFNEFIKKRCYDLWQNEDLIMIEEGSNNIYFMSMHISIWQQLFDPIINKIIFHVENIIESSKISQPEYIFLVGGFANSLYYQSKIKESFNRIKVIIPELPQLCVVDGAARYGLKPHFMKIRRLSKTYGIKANKPRENINNENIFPINYIKNNLIVFKNNINGKKEEHIKDCFMIFATKNEPIDINDKPIKKQVLKQYLKQTKALIEIYESIKIIPATCQKCDAIKRGQFIVNFNKNIKKLWVEFDYSDTMLTVHAYPHGKIKNVKNMIRIHYE